MSRPRWDRLVCTSANWSCPTSRPQSRSPCTPPSCPTDDAIEAVCLAMAHDVLQIASWTVSSGATVDALAQRSEVAMMTRFFPVMLKVLMGDDEETDVVDVVVEDGCAHKFSPVWRSLT
ncbi:unnamed protein product [Mycena citricolor]|uniref:Uncharacterized protein n=1 Tax=Mycena citricolor TaxID=2018698 RepID=A0AAD2H534_9AGAR|nr:unnamed protein product [Mycena citricolor]